jgi:hypothetical protein
MPHNTGLVSHQRDSASSIVDLQGSITSRPEEEKIGLRGYMYSYSDTSLGLAILSVFQS